MSNGWNLEIQSGERNGKPIVFLDFWDSLHGEDAHYILTSDGVIKTSLEEDEDSELQETVDVIVDLKEELIKLCEKLDKRGGV